MQKKHNKKAALTQTVIISIVIIILSAAIIFFFFKALPFKETIDKEACHQSVILRSQTVAGLQPGQTLQVPLNCKTQKITISSTNDKFIKREIANAMYDCWWMLGEGKLDFFDEGTWRTYGVPGLGTAKSSCVVCSVINFEEASKDKNLNFLIYLEETKIPSQNLTYLEYFTEQENTKLPAELKVDKLNTNQDYAIIFMGIRGGDFKEGLTKVIGAAAIGGLIGFKVGGLHGAGIGAAVGGGLQLILQPITQLTSAHASAIHCDGEKGGCFALILIPLEASEISAQCQNIESIP